MSYMRLFIELRKEESGAPCGQVRVELQDQPGRVDCKVRCSLVGLPAGQSYEMALLCEQGGRYQEYPLGQFGVNPRGQAGPMFRGSFPEEPGKVPVTEFKAVVARGAGDSRLVGFRFEPMLIPWRYEEEPEREAEPEPEHEPTPEVVPQNEPTPEVAEEKEALSKTMEEPTREETEILTCTSSFDEPETLTYTEIPEETVILPESMSKMEITEAPPVAVFTPEATSKANLAFAPEAIFVLRDLNQVDLMCGAAGWRAFQRYRHLILAQQGKENYLGIPCRFRSTHKEELAEEGYTLFYTPHGDEPGFGEFGYWMKRL